MIREFNNKSVVHNNKRLDFKHQLVKDLLYQIDYQAGLRNGVVTLPEDVMIHTLKKLPTSVLLAWYNSYLFFRREMMFSGYELHGLKVNDQPYDAIRERMNLDPDFDLEQYIL